MKRMLVLLFILLIFLAELFPAKSTLLLNLKGRGRDLVHTLNCHADFYTFTEVEKEETIKQVIYAKNSSWQIEQDGPFIWLKPTNAAEGETTLAILTESCKIFIFTINVVDNEEIFYPKIYITSREQ